MTPSGSTVTNVEGRELTLSNLDKVLYPETGFTKADLLWYYAHIAPYLLPHVADRPMTFVRFPNGVGGQSFFSKHEPKGTPDWIRTAAIPAFGRGKARGVEDVNYVIVDDTPTLLWAANLAALELHTPMWRVAPGGGVGEVDMMVFDLDPGEPADIMQCCIVAELVRELLQREGLQCFPKTSGSKGLQLYVPLRPTRPWQEVHERAHELRRELERTHPDEIVSNMRRDIRAGKILIDWSQNHGAKTTIAPYSLRARSEPTVSTPLTWEEVHRGTTRKGAATLRFVASDVLARVAEVGDLFAPLLAPHPRGAKPG